MPGLHAHSDRSSSGPGTGTFGGQRRVAVLALAMAPSALGPLPASAASYSTTITSPASRRGTATTPVTVRFTVTPLQCSGGTVQFTWDRRPWGPARSLTRARAPRPRRCSHRRRTPRPASTPCAPTSRHRPGGADRP